MHEPLADHVHREESEQPDDGLVEADDLYTVSSRNFDSRKFSLRVSNSIFKYIESCVKP